MAFYENINLEKGMYLKNGEGFTKALEALDPSENYKGTELEGLDAFERQLKRFDIKVSGKNSDCVEKFFLSPQSAVLFPEYVRRSVEQGLLQNSVLSDIVAATTKINALDYRPITTVSATTENGFEVVLEGALIPETKIKVQDKLIALKKQGRMLVSTYEALRFERLEVLTVTLKQIGAFIAKSQLDEAINVLVNGDGNNNAAAEITAATAGTLKYTDLVNLWSSFTDFEMNRMLVAPDVMTKLLALEEFKNPLTGLNFQNTGKISTPLGATLYRSESVPAGKIIAFDKNCALEMVLKDGVTLESDKLIDRQVERTAITATTGFAKIFKDAVKILKI